MSFGTFQFVITGGATPTPDAYGRHYVRADNGTIYLVPFAAVSETPSLVWTCHERHRIAVPADLPRECVRQFPEKDNPGEYGERSDILLVDAEHLACAELIAVATGARIFGWGTGVSFDCSGRSFASPAENFIVRNWDDATPGARSRNRTYGFLISSSIDC